MDMFPSHPDVFDDLGATCSSKKLLHQDRGNKSNTEKVFSDLPLFFTELHKITLKIRNCR